MKCMNNYEPQKPLVDPKLKAEKDKLQHLQIGIFLTVISLIAIIWAAWQLSSEPARIRAIPDSVSPLSSFPDIFKITDSPAALYSVIGGGAFIVLWTGLYRIIYRKPSTWHKFLAFGIGFAIIIGHAFYLNSVRVPVYDELVSVQHQWADERYGIIYDEVTILETEGRKNTTIKNQDKVIWDGEIIAEVCKDSRTTVLFCEPGTDQELFVMSEY